MSAEPASILASKGSTQVNQGNALPWSLIGAALAAMAAHYLTANRFNGLPVMGVLLVSSRLTTWRLPNHFLISYGLRAVILAVILTLINQTDPQDTDPWYLQQADTNLAGYAVAADIVLRAWERRAPAVAREGLGVVVLMTALLFAAACDTYERFHIQWIAPIYVLCLLLAFRSFAVMNQPARSERGLRPSLILLRMIAIFFTLGFAGASVYAVNRYQYRVENWAMQFVHQRRGETHEIGFSASPRLSNIFDPQPSSSRALIIDGEPSEPHFRVAAFDTYQSPEWKPAVSDRTFAAIAPPEDAGSARTRLLKVTRLSNTDDLIPAPLTTATVRTEDPLEQDGSGTLRDNRSGSLDPYSVFEVTSPAFQGLLCINPDKRERARLLVVPHEIDPRVIELARKIAGTGEPAVRAFRLQEYLRSQHAYSLSFQPHGEPLNDFILNGRAGHCQYFASAMVIMARAVGIPARYVAGFYAHEQYAEGEIVVRQRDAHAWAECWFDRLGWVTLDATPADGRPDQIFPDPPDWKRWWEKLNDLPAQIRSWLANNSNLLKELAALGAVIALCVWVIRKIIDWRRRPTPLAAPYPAPDKQLIEMAGRFDRWMKQRGIVCPPESTWRAHLWSRNDLPNDAYLNFVRTYDRARFGNRAEDLVNARELLERMEESV